MCPGLAALPRGWAQGRSPPPQPGRSEGRPEAGTPCIRGVRPRPPVRGPRCPASTPPGGFLTEVGNPCPQVCGLLIKVTEDDASGRRELRTLGPGDTGLRCALRQTRAASLPLHPVSVRALPACVFPSLPACPGWRGAAGLQRAPCTTLWHRPQCRSGQPSGARALSVLSGQAVRPHARPPGLPPAPTVLPSSRDSSRLQGPSGTDEGGAGIGGPSSPESPTLVKKVGLCTE